MANTRGQTRVEGEQIAAERSKGAAGRPPLYRVLLHNDDYTTMEFVVLVLVSVFHRTESEAVQIMLHVHRKGVGVAGVYPWEIAESRVAKVARMARQAEFPLHCTMEPTE
ncbi:MAG: ATP-dependent Clp protease adaptor ClpS [Proteobacteria bacterium]|nr:ATP-dependent Clp protease adaptor ClpS [Pseudomonadota bacterium]